MSGSAATRAKRALLGAVVADAATMPLHWIYGMDKVAEAIKDGADPAFYAQVSCPFYGPATYPGHYALNQLSPYGEEFMCLLKHMASNGGDFVSQEAFAADLEQWANTYGGRLNHCSKEFLENRRAGKQQPQGAKDAQMNSVVKAVIMACRYAGQPDLLEKTEACIRVHQNDDMAVQCGLLAARDVERAIFGSGEPVQSEQATYAQQYKDLSKPEFLDQLAKDLNITPAMYASSCGLPQAYTTCLYFLNQPTVGYADTVRENILFGGDNCSRAMFLGAIKATQAGEDGVPKEWLQRVENIKEIERMVDLLVSKRFS